MYDSTQVKAFHLHKVDIILAHKGPYTYYIITLGGLGGQGLLDDNDSSLRGGGG